MATDIIDRLKLQNDEFDALIKLNYSYNDMPAVVDDDHPDESALKTFLEACKNNGRI